MEGTPPLDIRVVEAVRELWPNATWSQSLRQQWRERLASFKTDDVLACVKKHHASHRGKSPCLADILSIYRVDFGAQQEQQRWQRERMTEREIQSQTARMRSRLLAMTPEVQKAARSMLESRLKKSLPSIEKCNPTQIGMLYGAASNICSSSFSETT